MIARRALTAKTTNVFQKRIYSPSDKAVYRMTSGLKLATIYGQSAVLNGDVRAMAKADILRQTYQPENIFTANDLLNRNTGELFDGYGTLVEGVCSRVSPSYLCASARRQRKRILAKFDAVELLVGQEWRFLTLTMPFLRTDVGTIFKIQTDALQNFKKNVAIWKRNVQGAFFAEEMVIGDSTTMLQTHFHIHVHILMLGKWIDKWLLADLWTNCVENACRRFGVEFLMTNLVSNRLVTDIQSVKKYADKNGKTVDDAVNELCKYTTKGSDYEKVPKREILEIEKALHNRPMIKTYGCFNNQKGTEKKETTGAGTSLDTKCTTDAIAKLNPKRQRETLTDKGERLIGQGRRGEWLRLLELEFERRREFRVGQLAFNQPHATFKTLDNVRWFGVSARPAKVVYSMAEHKVQKIQTDTRNDAELLGEIVDRYDEVFQTKRENAELLSAIVQNFDIQSCLGNQSRPITDNFIY